MEHKLSRKHVGKGEGGFIQPTCSCGWIGDPHYAYEDLQRHNVEQDEHAHLRAKEEAK